MISALQLLRTPLQFLDMNKRLGIDCHADASHSGDWGSGTCVEEQHTEMLDFVCANEKGFVMQSSILKRRLCFFGCKYPS